MKNSRQALFCSAHSVYQTDLVTIAARQHGIVPFMTITRGRYRASILAVIKYC